MGNGFRLKTVELEGFRGFNTKKGVSFDQKLTIIYGRNGMGKSSVLGGIEWSLFGDVHFINYQDSKIRDELVNQLHSSGISTVNTLLIEDGATIKVQREKKLGTRATDFKLERNGVDYEGDFAEKELFNIFGVTSDDFVRSVYLHQESVRGLLTDDPRKRDEALDRLFGLEKLRNLIESIPIKKAKDEASELETKKEKLGSKIKGALEQIQKDLTRLKTKAQSLGISESDISIDFAVNYAKSISTGLDALSTKYNMPKYTLANPLAPSDFDSFERKAKQALKEYEVNIIEDPSLGKLRQARRELEDSYKRQSELITEINTYSKKQEELRAKYGERTVLEGKIESAKEKISECVRKRKQLDVHSRLLEDALDSLRGSEAKTCPVCHQPINVATVIESLQEESARHLVEEASELDREKTEFEKELNQLQLAAEEFEQLSQKLNKRTEEVEPYNRRLRELLGQDYAEANVGSLVGAKLVEIDASISKLDSAFKTRATEIQGVRDQIDRLGAISNVLSKEAEFEELSKHNRQDSVEIQQIDGAISEMQKLEGRLETITRAISEVQVGLAAEMIRGAQNLISEYYARLCKHNYYDQVKIEVKTKEIRGLIRNSYAVKAFSTTDGKETNVASRFSTGQMNCVALAVYLALTKILQNGFSFLMLDDPSQSLDGEHKIALAELLTEISTERQVVVATQDMELVSLLKFRSPTCMRYHFTDWDKNGPKFTLDDDLARQ